MAVYRGVSAQERTAQRRERLLEAGLELLGTEGAAGTTVRAVCRRAGLTPRFFYESFADLDALLVAVYDAIVAEATTRMLTAMATAGDDRTARARAAIGAFVAALTDDPRHARVACVAALGSEPLARRRLATMRAVAALLADEARTAYRAGPQAEDLLQVTSHVLVGGLAELLIAWLDGALPMGRDQLVEDYVALFVAAGDAAAGVAASRLAAGVQPGGPNA
jgi:AcrR family transcriptional regulator